jgi:uncharacterized protein (TIGR02246 family)
MSMCEDNVTTQSMLSALIDRQCRVPDLDDPASLRGAVRGLLDREAIRDLVALYARAVDDHDIEAVVGTFAAHGIFDRRGDEAVGLGEIRESFVAAMRTYQAMLHTPESHVVTLTGPDHATGWASGHAELVTRRTTVIAAYRYDDAYCREDGRWRFSLRRVRFMYAVPAGEYGSGLSGPNRMRWPGAEPAPADYPESIDTWAASRR